MVWGGEKIAAYKGVESDDPKVGESWEISSYPGAESVVSEGPLEGKTLPELVREYKDRLVGKAVYERTGDEFPLLIKFIDARNDLSIQVHPDDAKARRCHNQPFGKTEMWYVIQADPGAHLYSGISKEITPEDYVRLITEDRIVDVLADHKVAPGDVFFLPAGRIHAICSGTFLAEIQQTSDLTYRIWDYGRLGLDGKPRALHTDLAKEAIDYKVYPSYKQSYAEVADEKVTLVSCPYFTTDLYDLDRPFDIPLEDIDSFLVVIAVDGSGALRDTEGHCVPIRRGESLLIPAESRGIRLEPEGKLKILTSCIC